MFQEADNIADVFFDFSEVAASFRCNGKTQEKKKQEKSCDFNYQQYSYVTK